MSKRYNARQEQARGRLTHDDIERAMSFGPGRDAQASSAAVTDIVGMLERTKWGKQYRMPAGLARIVGIKTSRTTDHSPLAATTELATVHDTLSGAVRYVGASSLPPSEIVPDLHDQLNPAQEQPAEAAAPQPLPVQAELAHAA